MSAHVISEIDPKNPSRTGYRITGPSFAAVQVEIDRIMGARTVDHGQFQIPLNDGEGQPGHEFIAFGQTFARDHNNSIA